MSYLTKSIPKGAPCDNGITRFGLICTPKKDECATCGWNPDVAMKRYEKTREELQICIPDEG